MNFVKASFREVNTEDIIIGNIELIFTYPDDFTQVKESIAKVGQIQPVILKQFANKDKYQIISGFKRILALTFLKVKLARAIIFQEEDIIPKDAFISNMLENASFRNFNIIEKSNCIYKLFKELNVSKDDIKKKYMPHLGIEPSEKLLLLYIELFSLSTQLKSYIYKNSISISNALIFLNFSPYDQKNLLNFLEKINVGTNKFKELVINIEEVCLRDSLPLKQVLEKKDLNSIFLNNNLSIPQKTNEAVAYFKRLKFPKLTKKEIEISDIIKNIKLPKGMNLTLPPFFEGETYKLSFAFNDKESFCLMANKAIEMTNKIDELGIFKESA